MTETPTAPAHHDRDPWSAPPPPADWGGAGQWPPSPLVTERPPVEPPPRRRRPVAALAVTALLAAAVGGGAGAAATMALDDGATPAGSATSSVSARTSTTGTVVPAAGTTAEVAAKVLPSVVTITARGQQGGGTGSGVVLDAQGHVLTNNHVVSGAGEGAQLRVTLQDGRRADATVVGTDPAADLAVIKVEGVSGLEPAAIGSSADLQVGDAVLAAGSPLGLSGTVTEGIISAKNRPVLTSGESDGQGSVLNALQTDTAINPGNSGGALVDMRGRLVGINSAIATLGGGLGQSESGNIGLGFAIPIDQAKRIADELIANGRATYARLGAQVADAPDGGAQLGAVEAGTAAAKAGLRQGDVVTAFNGQLTDSADSLVAAVRSAVPGSTVELAYTRGDSSQTVSVTLETVTSD